MYKWRKGYTPRFWKDDFKQLNYTMQPVTYEEMDEWVQKGYDYVKSFTGKMYDNRNPMPDWVERFKDIFIHYKNFTFTFYKMSTLEIMPEHSDHYRTYCKMQNAQYEDVVRILVMLEDWKPGHYLEIDGKAHVNWIAGDYFVWESGCPHAAANIGVEDRYTLQITATKIKTEEIWQSLHWYNIPTLKSKEESYKSLFLKLKILPKIPEDQPSFIYMINGEIKELKNVKHHYSVVNYLNDVGLHFYLYEPLCSYLANSPQLYPPHGTKHSMKFYSEFNDIRELNDLRSDELDSILDYASRNNLTNITVHTCDYQADIHYPYYTNRRIKLVYDDLFVKTMNPVKVNDTSLSCDFSKKFICLNWRYTPHRHVIAIYLAELESAYLSWYFKVDDYNMAYTPWMDYFQWKNKRPQSARRFETGLEFLNNHVPLNVDLDIKEATTFNHPYFRVVNPNNNTFYEYHGSEYNNNVEQFYRDSFCDIVTESRFAQLTGNYSEKVFQPMFYKKPFILVAPPKTLSILKQQGFKTFEDYWDESYDNSYEHDRRMFKIFDIIDYIESKSIEELREMYLDMAPILEHNYKLVTSLLS